VGYPTAVDELRWDVPQISEREWDIPYRQHIEQMGYSTEMDQDLVGCPLMATHPVHGISHEGYILNTWDIPQNPQMMYRIRAKILHTSEQYY